MTVRKGFLGAIGFALLAMGIQLPIQAQTVLLEETKPVLESASATEQGTLTLDDLRVSDDTADLNVTELNANEIEPAAWTNSENLSADGLALADEMAPTQAETPPAVAYPAPEEAEQLAQARRRTFAGARSASYIGIGADFGTTGDLSFAAISRFSLSDQLAIRPSVLLGDGFAVLVPVTYDFNTTSAGGFQIRPYAGVGASFVDSNEGDDGLLDDGEDSNLGLLLSAGVDVPLSRQFTANAQANFAGVFSDSTDFGVTVGVGYNFGGF